MSAPRLYFDSRLNDGALVASTTAAGTAADNLLDWRPYTWWRPTSLPATLTVDCGSAKPADYALIYGHDLASKGATVQVRASTDNFAASDVLVDTFTPTDTAPILRHFSAVSYRYWRLRVYGPTNLITYSEDLRNTAEAGVTRPWSQFVNADCEVALVSTTLPSGATGNASKLRASTTISAQRQTGHNLTVADNTVHTVSVYAKAAELTAIRLYPPLKDGTFPWVTFNLSNGTVSATNGAITASGIVSAGNGWYRCWCSASSASGGTTPSAIYQLNTQTMSVGDGVLLWGAQCEAETSPTAYTATTAAAVTTSPAASLAIAAIGSRFELPGYLGLGFDPTAREVVAQSNVNANGQPLGKVIEYTRQSRTLQIRRVTWSWLRDTFLPAWRTHLRSSPFVFAWNSAHDPSNVVLVVAGDSLSTPHIPGGYCDVQFEISGAVD